MKELKGYLIDRTTGVGIAGKTVSFLKLDATAVPATASGTTTGAKDAVTDANGRFSAWWELSPGPVNVQVDVSGTEKKIRKWEEKAQLGYQWSSDISRLARGFQEGFVRGFLSEMVPAFPGGHTFRISTGLAFINGSAFSIELNPIDITIPDNNNAAINPRLDLITLRQYNESAAGQDSGRQDIIVTQGSSSNVAPATPTGASFKDLPLAVVSTAYLGSTVTLATNGDKRTFGNPTTTDKAPKTDRHSTISGITLSTSYTDITSLNCVLSSLDPNVIYDGYQFFFSTLQFSPGASTIAQTIYTDLVTGKGYLYTGTDLQVAQSYAPANSIVETPFTLVVPIIGLTGVTSVTYTPRLRVASAGLGNTLLATNHVVVLKPRV